MTHVLRRDLPRRLVSPVRTLVLLILCLATFGVSNAQPPITVVVNDRPIIVFDRTSIADAMQAAGVRVRDGILYSAGQGVILDDEHSAPVILRNGEPADKSTRLRNEDVVQASDGLDALETVEVELILTPSGLPEVEHRLWHAGREGIDEVLKGSRSGEILSRTTTVPMVPAEPEEAQVVSLTFDDGPDPRWTIPILENLKREGIQATFCVVGTQSRKFPELIMRIVEEGHTLCDHTETHPVGLSRLARSEIDIEIGTSSFFLRSLTGAQPAFFRAPGGSINELVIGAAQSRGMRVLAWSVDPRDFEGASPAVILSRVMEQVRPGSVILLHDGGGVRSNTVAALPGLITQLRAAGYEFRLP